jgi:phosphate transport system substrate-binding protein
LSGSNTIGSSLALDLAEAYLRQPRMGLQDVGFSENTPVSGYYVQGRSNKGEWITITIAAQGTEVGLGDLADGRADIAMASRELVDGDSKPPHLVVSKARWIGYDGVAIIANNGNPISSLTVCDIAKLFTGAYKAWSDVGVSQGRVHVYARNKKSGTYETFKYYVLDPCKDVAGSEIASDAQRFEDSNALSNSVANDADGIGFVGLPFVRGARAVAISGGEGDFMLLTPTRVTVATGAYPLSRPLFLCPDPSSAEAERFVDYVRLEEGQNIVDKNYISQTVRAEKSIVSKKAPEDYRALTIGKSRLSVDVRFNVNSATLSDNARPDIDRIATYLKVNHVQGSDVLLIGFTDSSGNQGANLKLSRARANAVAKALDLSTATIVAVGSKVPLSPEGIRGGRDKNRRVEVWIKSSDQKL